MSLLLLLLCSGSRSSQVERSPAPELVHERNPTSPAWQSSPACARVHLAQFPKKKPVPGALCQQLLCMQAVRKPLATNTHSSFSKHLIPQLYLSLSLSRPEHPPLILEAPNSATLSLSFSLSPRTPIPPSPRASLLAETMGPSSAPWIFLQYQYTVTQHTKHTPSGILHSRPCIHLHLGFRLGWVRITEHHKTCSYNDCVGVSLFVFLRASQYEAMQTINRCHVYA